MNQVVIDLDKCEHDGICAAVCPRRLIEFTPEDPTPRPIPTAGEQCIRCGHCLAACPAGAVSVAGVDPQDCPPIRPELLPGPEQLDHLFRARRSIRCFKKQPLDRATVERLLETCRCAPTGSNSQSVNWVVVAGEERLKALAGLVIDWMRQAVEARADIAIRMNLGVVVEAWDKGQDRIFRGAPLLVITHSLETASMARENCVIALTYLDLAAAAMGLGACWVGYMMLAGALHPPLNEALGLPQGHRLYGAMLLGQPRYKYLRLPPRDPGKVVWW